MAKRLSWSVLALILVWGPGANAGLPTRAASPALPPAWQTWVLAESGLVFDVPPIAGAEVRGQFFPQAVPGRQLRETASVTVDGVERVRVDVWREDRAVDLLAWFDARFSTALDAEATLWTTVASAEAVPALGLSRPAACGVEARQLLTLQIGPWVVVASLNGADDPEARAAFETVLATLRTLVEGGR